MPLWGLIIVVFFVIGLVVAAMVVGVPLLGYLWSWLAPREPLPQITPLSLDIGDQDEDLMIRLIVLKAYSDGRAECQHGQTAVVVDAAQEALAVVEGAKSMEHAGGIRRRSLYLLLLLAELKREGDPIPWRRRARGQAAVIENDGVVNGFDLYMVAVDASADLLRTGHFRDITEDGLPLVRTDEPAVRRAIGLREAEVDSQRQFVFDMPTREAIQLCMADLAIESETP
jgi:hypothetical protein